MPKLNKPMNIVYIIKIKNFIIDVVIIFYNYYNYIYLMKQIQSDIKVTSD